MNHAFRDTYIEREPGETANNRNDRAIRVAAKWYDEHLFENQRNISLKKVIRIVLLTGDTDNKEKATQDGIFAASGKF